MSADCEGTKERRGELYPLAFGRMQYGGELLAAEDGAEQEEVSQVNSDEFLGGFRRVLAGVFHIQSISRWRWFVNCWAAGFKATKKSFSSPFIVTPSRCVKPMQ